MKKLITPLLGLALLTVACTKSSSTPSTTTTSTTTTTTTSYPNKLTVSDNGTTLIAEGVGTTAAPPTPVVLLVVQKYTSNSVIQLSTWSNNFKDYNLALLASEGPVSGIGTFVIHKTSGPVGNTFIEKFSGGLSYNIDSAVVITTTCSSSNVTGTFTLWLSNTSGNKTVTGSFNCNQPSIM